MKNHKKTITMLLTAALLLFMSGCTSLTETKNRTPSEVDAPAESDGFGVYIKLERDDASSIALHGGSFTKVCENADGSLLKAGEWIFTGDDIVQLSKEENSSVLFTVRAHDADDMLLGEGTFLYDVTQEKLHTKRKWERFSPFPLLLSRYRKFQLSFPLLHDNCHIQ